MERELLSDCHDSLSMAGVATDSTTQVSSPLSAAAGLAGQMACEGRAQHMLGGCEYINHGDSFAPGMLVKNAIVWAVSQA